MDVFVILFSKPSLFSVLGLTSIVLGIPLGIMVSRKDGPQAIAALLIFGFVLLRVIQIQK